MHLCLDDSLVPLSGEENPANPVKNQMKACCAHRHLADFCLGVHSTLLNFTRQTSHFYSTIA